MNFLKECIWLINFEEIVFLEWCLCYPSVNELRWKWAIRSKSSCGQIEHSQQARSVLLMPYPLVSPGHQQPRYWLCAMAMFFLKVNHDSLDVSTSKNERAIGDCLLAKICWSVCETETWISDSQSNLLHFELLIASLAKILTELL